MPREDSGALFSKVPNNLQARKGVVAYIQDQGFNSFADNMIKSSVNKTKWTGLSAVGSAHLFFRFLLEYLMFGPEKLLGLSRNGSLGRVIRLH